MSITHDDPSEIPTKERMTVANAELYPLLVSAFADAPFASTVFAIAAPGDGTTAWWAQFQEHVEHLAP